jgi:hypothetical protein
VVKVPPGNLIGGSSCPQRWRLSSRHKGFPPSAARCSRSAHLTVSPAIAELRVNVEEAQRLRQAGRYEAASIVLPELIGTSRAAAVQDTTDAWWYLAVACQVAASIAYMVGERDLAWIAADRAVTVAERSGDELLVAASMRWMTFALLGLGPILLI